MIKVKFEHYKNDYDKMYEERSFYTIEDLEEYLIKANEMRDNTPRNSKYWRSPVGTSMSGGEPRGWYRTSASANQYELWLKKVTTDTGVIVFEEGHYCSPKFYNFLNKINKRISEKPVYGDF